MFTGNKPKEQTGTVTFRLPLDLRAQLEVKAAEQGLTRSQYVAGLIFVLIEYDLNPAKIDESMKAWSQAEGEVDELKKELGEVKKKLTEAQKKATDAQKAGKEVQTVKGKATKLESEKKALQSEITKLKAELKKAQAEEAKANKTAEKFIGDMSKEVEKEQKAMKAEIAKLKKSLGEYQGKVKSLQSRVDKANAKFKEDETGKGFFGGQIFQV